MGDYQDYASSLVSQLTGKNTTCFINTSRTYFLPGSTESSFRQNEKTIVNHITTTGYKEVNGRTNPYVIEKTAPKKTVGDKSATFYAMRSKNNDSHYLYSFIFDKSLNQGYMIYCFYSKH